MKSLQLWVAPVSLRWYAEGEHCYDPVPGDLFIVDHVTTIAKAITLGEKLLTVTQPELKGYTWTDHVAWIRNGQDALRFPSDAKRHYMGRPADIPDFIVSEMGPRGHEYESLFSYVDRLYCVAHFDVPDPARQMVLDNDDRCVGIGYDWWSYPSLIADGLTGCRFFGGYGSTMICSTETTVCATGLYWFPDRDAAGTAPAHNAAWVGAYHEKGLHLPIAS